MTIVSLCELSGRRSDLGGADLSFFVAPDCKLLPPAGRFLPAKVNFPQLLHGPQVPETQPYELEAATHVAYQPIHSNQRFFLIKENICLPPRSGASSF